MVVCDYTYNSDTRQLKVNCLNCMYGSSVEDYPVCMARTIDKLIETKGASNIILAGSREYEYNEYQTKLLNQLAEILVYLLKSRKILSQSNFGGASCNNILSSSMDKMHNIVTVMLREDPIGAYVFIIREIRYVKEYLNAVNTQTSLCFSKYLDNVLMPIKEVFESLELIQVIKNRLSGHVIGDRLLYREFFRPMIKPNFMLTRYMITPPSKGKTIDKYMVGDTEVQIIETDDDIQKIYHIIPPEFKLREDQYSILDAARRYMSVHKPRKTEFAEPKRMRQIFMDIGRDMISELSDKMNVSLNSKNLDVLSNILTRYTAGYGILEVILADENVQDIYINAPMGYSPIYVYHGTHEECTTNIVPTREDALAWATRFRIESGRPLDEANPVLDTEISVPGARARVAALTNSLSPDGFTFVLRRHRDKPWTYPLFMNYNMMTPLSAGLLSFLIDGARTMLFAGTRSAGKSSLLGATLTELMRKVRIITVEDTLELPIEALRNLKYDIQSLKSRSILTHVETELPADEAIRTSLRLGDSCLIVGEVRSVEAKALYESMRIGALANLVAGTIHGDSPYGVFDRVVNDLGVPATSFKATDIITVVNRLKSADGLSTFRRIMEITEVTKDWDDNPLREKGFQQLMVYNSKTDHLEPTERLLNGESLILNEIAKRVKDWRDDWESMWGNIKLRSDMKETLLKYAKKTGNYSILEADFTVNANDKFHKISSTVKKEVGSLDSQRIFALWDEWVKQKIKEQRRI
ncbi:MAG: type II/IV secretion system ATPase subunit [DPANN group archaeon]|nr:type II/IV secretion system ATPase subunit [DPANN group archaeon]